MSFHSVRPMLRCSSAPHAKIGDVMLNFSHFHPQHATQRAPIRAHGGWAELRSAAIGRSGAICNVCRCTKACCSRWISDGCAVLMNSRERRRHFVRRGQAIARARARREWLVLTRRLLDGKPDRSRARSRCDRHRNVCSGSPARGVHGLPARQARLSSQSLLARRIAPQNSARLGPGTTQVRGPRRSRAAIPAVRRVLGGRGRD